MMTRAGVERIQRFGFKLAQSRPRKLLTVVTKSNAQRHAMVMWDEIASEVAKDFPDVKWDKEMVDAATARMVNRPASLDTIVATNLHADILSDLAAALAGSLGIGPTANINPERVAPSMFEPIHGSAFDIMGKGVANPVGTFWTCVMMLEHLGETEAARRLMQAIEHVTANEKLHTRDLGGTAMTAEVTEAVCAEIASSGQEAAGDCVSALAAMSDIEARVTRKLRWRILPFVMLLYFVSFLDRVNVGFAAFSMNKAIGLSSSAYGFGSGIFFLGYIIFQVPANLIMMRVGARVWIARVVIVWGLVSVASAFVDRAAQLLRAALSARPGGVGILSRNHSLSEPVVSCARAGSGNCRVHGRRAALDRDRLADFRRVDGAAAIPRPDELAVALHY